MKIILSPIASNRTTRVFVNGLTITVDDQDIDLSVIPENGYAIPEEGSPLMGKITRKEVTVLYHYDSFKALPNQSMDWADYTFEVENGEVPCPIIWEEE
jgi:hypothetical protein